MNTREYSELQKLYSNIINEYDEGKSAASAEKNLLHSFNKPGSQAPGYKYSGRMAPNRNGSGQVPEQKRVQQDLKAATQRSQQRQLQMNSYDPFEIVKNHLLDEGYASDERSAFAIMASMSEGWTESILEAEVLAKKGGVEGVGTGANWKAKSWTGAEKSRFAGQQQSTAAKPASSSSSSSGQTTGSTPSDAVRDRLASTEKYRKGLFKIPSKAERIESGKRQGDKFDEYQRNQRASGYYKPGYKELPGTFEKG